VGAHLPRRSQNAIVESIGEHVAAPIHRAVHGASEPNREALHRARHRPRAARLDHATSLPAVH
jgi:hypothetical protein